MAMFSKLKQFKDLRSQAKSLQNTLAEETVYADGAHGKVQVVMDGNQHVNGVQIDPELLKVERKTDIEKGIADAVNSAVKKSQMAMAKKAREMGHLNLPGLS
ncbi:MAG: YbaB/EbfC family nucleoid-associated protein [Candidatus Kerfeldbacteria bacterium]|nr:YbaB/EbfC family nucleoid-associated protein [Candidatus Kerfeldbacteria bacterium]